MKGRLNLFQATMLGWRELHPYSASHAIRIDAPLDVPRLSRAIEAELVESGLTGLVIDIARLRYEYTGGAAEVALAVHPAGADPLAALALEFERQLNLPFAGDGRLDPFRFFAIDAGASFRVGVAYDHFIAGGDSIVLLLAGIFDRYTGRAARARVLPYDRHPPTWGRLFVRQLGPLLRGLGALPQMRASLRRAVRPRYPGGTDGYNAWAYFRLDPAEFALFRRTAGAWGVTSNDLTLALALMALAPVAGERVPTRRRHELAVASIVNVRRDFGLDVNRTFGQFLCSFRVSHAMPDGISLERLARDIHAETARIRTRKLYLQNLLALNGSRIAWRFLSRQDRIGFHAKYYPVWGGVTMLDVDALWQHAGGELPAPEYIRAVSTGPVAPIIFAPTIVGGVLHVGASFRTAAFSREIVDNAISEIINLVRQFPA